MISGSGVIGLYWEGNGCYASIDFDGSGYYCYIADCGDEEAGEDKVPVAQALPQRLLEVIAMTADISDRHGLSRGIPRGRGAYRSLSPNVGKWARVLMRIRKRQYSLSRSCQRLRNCLKRDRKSE